MECNKKQSLLKFYYLVGFNIVIAGNVSSQGLPHVADIFRILNNVDIPAIDSFFPLISPKFPSFLGVDNQQGPTSIVFNDIDDIRLYVVDENDPTVKQEVSRLNYLNRMTGILKTDDKDRKIEKTSENELQGQDAIRDGVREGNQAITNERLKVDETDGSERDKEEVTSKIDIDNEVELVKDGSTKRRRNKLKIIVHGWGESASKSWYAQMTAAYMLKETEKKQELPNNDVTVDLKVLQVDWSIQAAAEYSIAARNTRRVGHYVGQFIADLYKNLDYALDDVHVIGHSLGGHVAGFIGKEVLRITGQSIGRITALDPAGPLFEGTLISKEDRLTESDAKLVDVVHTDGGFFGYKIPIGTIDFFPNGGIRVQPGCDDVNVRKLTMDEILEFAFCSHTRSYKYFIESIESNRFMAATKCDSWANYQKGLCSDEVSIKFGEDVPFDAETGSYFLETSFEPPYAVVE